jgi:hypothetical protein
MMFLSSARLVWLRWRQTLNVKWQHGKPVFRTLQNIEYEPDNTSQPQSWAGIPPYFCSPGTANTQPTAERTRVRLKSPTNAQGFNDPATARFPYRWLRPRHGDAAASKLRASGRNLRQDLERDRKHWGRADADE